MSTPTQVAQVAATLGTPQEAESDGLKAKQFSGTDQIDMARFVLAAAGVKTRNRGVYFSKFINPGAVSDQQATMAGGTSFDSPGE